MTHFNNNIYLLAFIQVLSYLPKKVKSAYDALPLIWTQVQIFQGLNKKIQDFELTLIQLILFISKFLCHPSLWHSFVTGGSRKLCVSVEASTLLYIRPVVCIYCSWVLKWLIILGVVKKHFWSISLWELDSNCVVAVNVVYMHVKFRCYTGT